MATPEPGNDGAAVESVVVSTRLLYTPRQAAGALGIGRSKLYELLRSGELESIHIGAARRIPLGRSMSSSSAAGPARTRSDDLPDISHDAIGRDDPAPE